MDYFSGQDSDSSPSTKPKIFKQRKTNLPSSKKYKPPEDKGGGLIILNTVSTLSSARECVAEFELVSSSESDSNYSSVSFEPVLSDDFASSFSISYFLL